MTPGFLVAVLLFTQDTAKLGTQPCGPGPSTGCYSNYLVVADLDGDDDLDVVFANGGGYYTAGSAAPMTVLMNDGAGNFTDVNLSAFGGFTARLRQVAVGDIDGDGDLDVVAPDSWAMQPDAVFVNMGGGTFMEDGANRLGTSSRAAGSRFADVDGDGDLDLLLTDWGAMPPMSSGTAKVYRNDGTGHFTEITGAVPTNTGMIGTGPIDIDFFDADGDWDLDVVLASRVGESLLFLNDGDGTFADANLGFPDQSGPYVYGPDECDVDGDGDLDVWLDNGTSPLREQLLINHGDGTFSDETAARVTGNPSADDNEVQCVDIDGDGDLDAIVASLSDEERVLKNDGAGNFALEAGDFPAVGDSTLGLDLGDVDGDGRLDAVTAQGEQTPYLNRLYLGIDPLPMDTAAPTFRGVEQVGAGAPAIRFAVVDASTTDVGPRLSDVWVEVDGVRSDAHFIGGDLFRADVGGLAAGQSYQACAKDTHGNQGCSAMLTVTAGGAPDAGMGGADAGAGVDAGSGADAGMGGGGDDGCGCQTTDASGGGLVLLLALLLYPRRRRRA